MLSELQKSTLFAFRGAGPCGFCNKTQVLVVLERELLTSIQRLMSTRLYLHKNSKPEFSEGTDLQDFLRIQILSSAEECFWIVFSVSRLGKYFFFKEIKIIYMSS